MCAAEITTYPRPKIEAKQTADLLRRLRAKIAQYERDQADAKKAREESLGTDPTLSAAWKPPIWQTGAW